MSLAGMSTRVATRLSCATTRLRCDVGRAKNFAMLHFPRKPKLQDLADALGIHRVSFWRVAQSERIPGLKRTKSRRLKVVNRRSFLVWAKEYRGRITLRCYNLERAEQERWRGREAGERMQRRYGLPALPESTVAIPDGEGVNMMTTTELGRRLGVTSQTVRNWRRRIPGAQLVGHRLKIKRSELLDRWIAEFRRSTPRGFQPSTPKRRRKERVIERQQMLHLI